MRFNALDTMLPPACARNVEYAIGEDGRVHLRFDMLEIPPCFGAFHDLLSSHLGDRMVVTFRGETLVAADLHTPLGPFSIVLMSKHRRVALDAVRFLGG